MAVEEAGAALVHPPGVNSWQTATGAASGRSAAVYPCWLEGRTIASAPLVPQLLGNAGIANESQDPL